MDITHDLIAAVSAPDWKYGLSRLLINDMNEGVIFIAGSTEPFAYFEVVELRARTGTGTLADGGTVTWRRRGSSCQYKLAKCKVDTSTLQGWWDNALEPAEPAEPALTVDADESEPAVTDGVPDGSASVVMGWVDGDPERARLALDAENEGQQRKGLTADLEKVIAAEDLI